jgi:hypothetical protein
MLGGGVGCAECSITSADDHDIGRAGQPGWRGGNH